LREIDRKAACAALGEIETDLVFGLIENYREGRSEDFGTAILVVRYFIEIRKSICGK